ncbi:MAG TPA: GAF domain-containing sensor histidine kinase [Ktedonobacteraceae bacterium]|nr:GAF domain-containing sensor histidine kinase [Ktedonobacteraceae bacterium]
MNHAPVSASFAGTFEPRSEIDTRLHGSWLVLARLVCLTLCALSVGFYVAGVLSYIAHDYLFCSGPVAACHTYGNVVVPPHQGPGLSREAVGISIVVRDSIFSLGYWLMAAFLFWRKSDDRVALLAAVSLGIFPLVFNLGFISTLPSPWWFPASVVRVLGSLCFILFYYVFPDGRFVPPWARWVFVVFVLYEVLNTFFPAAAFNPFSRSPVLGDLIFFGQIGSFVVVQLYRYRHVSSPAQRQQTKWVVYGISMGWSAYLVNLILSLFFPVLTLTGPLVAVVASAVVYGFLLLLPLSLGLAIVRTRLWDIDILINRTLVYGILSVCIVGVYVLVVGALGTLIGTSGDLLISLVATGLVAVLFQPVRAWVQRGVNRLLFGQRDEPYTVITHLSQRLEGTLAPDTVLPTIVETVAQTLKLPYVAILLKQEDTFRLAASAGELVGDPLILSLVYQKDAIGQMRLAPRTPGEPFTPADRRLLDELARQAGLAAHTVQLTADLQRSYEHLEQRVQERTRELTSLLEISHTVASTLRLKPLLGLILDQLKLVIDYTGSSILTIEEDSLVFLDHRGPVPEEQLVRLHFPLEQMGSIWETIASSESILIRDVYEETPLAQALRAAMGNLLKTTFQYVCSWMAVPLMLREQVIGMLVLTSKEANAFTSHHATLALAIANQAAIAIENARLYEQAQELAALEERQKLARELHDSVSQALYSIALGLHTARIQLDRDPLKLPESLDDLLSLTQTALTEMRALIFELRPESLEREGLVAALSRQGAALQARHEMIVQTDLCEEPILPLKTKQELHRIAQEALHNAVKHAHASKVNLALRRTANTVILEIGDDGVGFDPLESFPGHLGLRSMQERVSNLGGRLQIESTPGQGTRILTQVPSGRSFGDDLDSLQSM